MAARRERALPTQLEAFVLHRYDWSESSLILELFTRERGRLAAVAKGAKRPTSQLRAVLLPFQRVQVTLGRTAADEQAELHVLRHAEWMGGLPLLPPAALFGGFYLNELLMKLIARQDPHLALFDAYAETLPALATGDELHAQAALRAFELRALREAGILPDLSMATVSRMAVEDAQSYLLRPELGVVQLPPSGASAGPAAPGAAIRGAQLKALQKALDAGQLGELQAACLGSLQPLRGVLREWLHYHLGQPRWRTREVMHSVQRLLESAT
jgi:DNA repair protein RecO (recombination protein O)